MPGTKIRETPVIVISNVDMDCNVQAEFVLKNKNSIMVIVENQETNAIMTEIVSDQENVYPVLSEKNTAAVIN